MSSSVKAGLIGAAAAVVLSLLSLIPCLGCISSILGFLLYVAVGVLAAYWMEPPRTAGAGAGAGAVAGLITSLVGGIATMIVSTLRFLISGGAQAAMTQIPSQLPPELLDQLNEMGIDLTGAAMTIGGVLGISAMCCVAGLVLAAALGAIGGAITASVKSD
jgi:hypothetical protein